MNKIAPPPFLPTCLSSYYEIYEELRYVYTVEELEYARKNYGNQILYELHREEFGCYPYFDR